MSDVLLSITAVAGAICLVVILLGLALDVRPVIFRSGSMGPAIPTGSLGFAASVGPEDIRVGDVVSVPFSDTYVTHRVVRVHYDGGAASLTLKGDANRSADPQPYSATHARKLWFSVPVLGAVVAWLSKTPGIYVLGLYAAVMLALLMRRSGDTGHPGPDDRPEKTCPQRQPRRIAGAHRSVVVGGLALVAIAVPAAPGWAVWSDAAAVGGTTLQAHQVVPPDSVNCSNQVGAVRIQWPETNSLYDYSVSLRPVAGGAASFQREVTGTATETTYSALGFGFGLGTKDYFVDVRSKLATTPGWESSAVATYSKIRVSSLLASVSVTCSP